MRAKWFGYFTQENIWVANKPTKTCSTLLQGKCNIIKCHYTSTKRARILKDWPLARMQSNWNLYMISRNAKQYSHFGKPAVSVKVNRILLWPCNPSYCSKYLLKRNKNLGPQKNLYENVHNSFTHYSQKLKQPKSPTTVE